MIACLLCKSSQEDDIQYGEIMQNDGMAVHTFCLYLSSNLKQTGEDDEGFLGFLEADIKKESRRVSHLHCCYCRKTYANVGCCNKKCRNAFHFICGLKNGAENQFCGSYESYCHRHVSNSKFPLPPKNATCVICFDNLLGVGTSFNRLNSIQAPCCRNGWFHKLCLQRSAKTAGYFFKCPLCNDMSEFRQQLLMRGIFIPNQDAAWELEPNAFEELLERPNECMAADCKQGRTSSSRQNRLIFCSMCGSNAMHLNCMPKRSMTFHCPDCTKVIDRSSSKVTFNEHDDCEKYCNDEAVCNVTDKQDMEILRGLFPPMPSNAIEKKAEENTAGNSSSSSVDERGRVPMRRQRMSSDSCDSENKPRRRRTVSSCSDDVLNVSVVQGKNLALKANRAKLYNTTQSSTTREESQPQHSKYKVGVKSKNRAISEKESICEDEIDSGKRFRRSDKRSNNPRQNDDEKQIKLHSKCDSSKRKSNDVENSAVEEFSSSENSDDDPLENFTKLLQKQKDKSFIAQRTRSGDKLKNNTAIKNGLGCSKSQDHANAIKFQDGLGQANDKNSVKSCTARSLRRQTVFCKSAEQKNEVNSLLPTSSLSSNITKRSRPSSTQTLKDKFKQCSRSPDANGIGVVTTQNTKETNPFNMISYEMSQIYEKVDDTDNDEPGTPHNANTNILEISCIANRTRKRKSLKLQDIIEEDESNIPSDSTPIDKTALPDLRSKSATRLRPRILPLSCKNTADEHNDARAICRHRPNEKWPKENYEMAYRSKVKTFQSSVYHPNIRKQYSY